VDFCRVRVYSKSAPEGVLATLFMTYTPSLGIRADQPVHFRLWPQGKNAESIRIDFGDGSAVADYAPYSEVIHRFKKPGIHIVTASAISDGLPVTQKRKVVVE